MSKQALGDLITFIYSGEVKVSQESFEDFLNTAKALEIKGVADVCYDQAFNSRESKPIWSTPSQYQSTRTVHVPESDNPDLAYSKSKSEFQFQDDFAHESVDSMNGNGNGVDLDTNYDYDTRIDSPSMLSTDLTFDNSNDRWNGNNKNDSNETLKNDDAPKTKRVKRNYGKQSFGTH